MFDLSLIFEHLHNVANHAIFDRRHRGLIEDELNYLRLYFSAYLSRVQQKPKNVTADFSIKK